MKQAQCLQEGLTRQLIFMAICGLSLLLVLFRSKRLFLGTPVFS